MAEPASVNAKQQNARGLSEFAASQSCALDGAWRAHEAPPETHIPPAEEQEVPVNARQQNAPPGLGGLVSQSCALDDAC